MAFDEAYYLKHNPDVAAAVKAGHFASAADHYNQYGAKEGRTQSQTHAKSGFDRDYYLNNNQDVKKAIDAGQIRL